MIQYLFDLNFIVVRVSVLSKDFICVYTGKVISEDISLLFAIMVRECCFKLDFLLKNVQNICSS